MHTDLPLEQLRAHRSDHRDPEGFDELWRDTLAAARAAGGEVIRERVETGLAALDVHDVTFPGHAGEPVRAWLRLPRGARGPLPAVVEHVGHGGGRGHPAESLPWASAGHAHLHADTRGQGAGWSRGDPPDSGPVGPEPRGVMTRGVRDPATHRRHFSTDAARAVDAARALPEVDPVRVAVIGTSQGGGAALAVAALVPDVAAVAAHVPFLCDVARALVITDAYPYREVVDHLAVHRDQVEAVHRTLAHAGPRQTDVWPHNGHEGGGPDDAAATLASLREHLRPTTTPPERPHDR